MVTGDEVTLWQKVEFVCIAMGHMFMAAPLKEKITDIIMSLFLLTGISNMIIYPLIFNYIVQKRIEKKLGKKLDLTFLPYDIQLFGHFLYRHIFIVRFILLSHWRCKWGLKRNPLVAAGYDIKQASRLEIIMSYAAFISLVVGLLCILVGSIYLTPK